MKKTTLTAVLASLVCTSAIAQSARTIQVLSATVKDQRIAGAEVILQKNGAQSVVGYTDQQGNITLTAPFADDATAHIIIKKAGYSTLVAKGPSHGLTYAISPVMQNLDGMRIVLSWGADPQDLDSHLSWADQHVYYVQKRQRNANLDVDDTDSYGPETVTIEERQQGQEYVYMVHDYTDRSTPTTQRLSASQAKVFVYVGESLVRTFYVPTGQVGNLWSVFKIGADGDIQDINQITQTNSDRSTVQEHVAAVAPYQVGAESQRAVALNADGEAAYHSKNLLQAVTFYTMAIDEDPNYGQAYSNLGLAYKKLGRNAEALWANRKAIALAHGPTAATVRASSWYNIARIYEERKDYRRALQYYQTAKRNNDNPVYDKAILRVRPLVR